MINQHGRPSRESPATVTNVTITGGSDIIVTGEGELQVFDMMGRMIYTRYLNGVGTHRVCPSQYGVYIFKLNEKTQKIVIQ
ncbi:MAG: T9SS type A sorting domain-containing protein [Bacteroidales bacterium]|nr:T9SS type A sorting domain-containing protein [Bacteroidales bacterium]